MSDKFKTIIVDSVEGLEEKGFVEVHCYSQWFTNLEGTYEEYVYVNFDTREVAIVEFDDETEPY